jgi:hypothetical protein
MNELYHLSREACGSCKTHANIAITLDLRVGFTYMHQ